MGSAARGLPVWGGLKRLGDVGLRLARRPAHDHTGIT